MDPAQVAAANRGGGQPGQGPDLHPIAQGLAQLAQASGDPRLQQAAALVADVAANPGGSAEPDLAGGAGSQGPPVQ